MKNARLQTNSEQAVRQAITRWIEFLVKNDFEGAAEWLAPIPDRGSRFTANSIKEGIWAYSRKYREARAPEKDLFIPKVCDPAGMRAGERLEFYPTKNQRLTVEYSMPLDGEWSDLTAIFEVFPIDQGFCLGLVDLRVL